MLNVQKVRLRFIFARALYPVSLFSKASGKVNFKSVGDTAHLRCRIVKTIRPCTVLTASFTLTRNIASRTGCQWFHTASSFSFMKNSKFRNVQGRTFLNDGIRATSENTQRIISTTDGGGVNQ